MVEVRKLGGKSG